MKKHYSVSDLTKFVNGAIVEHLGRRPWSTDELVAAMNSGIHEYVTSWVENREPEFEDDQRVEDWWLEVAQKAESIFCEPKGGDVTAVMGVKESLKRLFGLVVTGDNESNVQIELDDRVNRIPSWFKVAGFHLRKSGDNEIVICPPTPPEFGDNVIDLRDLRRISHSPEIPGKIHILAEFIGYRPYPIGNDGSRRGCVLGNSIRSITYGRLTEYPEVKPSVLPSHRAQPIRAAGEVEWSNPERMMGLMSSESSMPKGEQVTHGRILSDILHNGPGENLKELFGDLEESPRPDDEK